MCAAGALVTHLRDTQKAELAHVRTVRLRQLADGLIIDPTTLKHLEVVESSAGGRSGSLLDEIDRTVGRVNGDFAAVGWTPVQYIFRSLEPRELLAYYRASDVALITPLKDGMNLVCKEYCACSLENDGVLVLSEFAGAARELQVGALLVNPFDTDAVAEAIHTAATMSVEERRARMQGMRAHVREHDVYRWVESFLAAMTILPLTSDVAPVYGRIRATLEAKGTPIGPHDLMIAAHAVARKLTLVSGNLREFRRVPGLACVDWTS